MNRETPTIQAQPRDRVGTRYSQRLRKTGRLPGVIYGHKTEPVSISVDAKEALAVIKRGAHVVNLAMDSQSETCLVKELQFGFLGDDLIHIDFARVDLNEEVEVKVHLKFTGQPEAAKKPGAVLTHPVTELEVICKVSEIPSEIKVDISRMEEMVTVREIQLPPGVRTNEPPDRIVAQITLVAEEVVPVAAEAAEVTAVAGAEPEVITEKKAEERAAAAAEGKEKKE
jgi:large subunit ribosomal protein L25